ncbi:protein GET1-like isoform X3 [Apium graveolens]|uniref:protein GET1-like isoform X3 n=1 Tax=Apium graveolens TaxID=4045 RepID=UPI003D79B8E2
MLNYVHRSNNFIKKRAHCHNQELQSKEISLSFDAYSKKLTMLKIFTYAVFAYWFWGSPVAAIPYQLVQPFGRFLSWRSGGYINDYVMMEDPYDILCPAR